MRYIDGNPAIISDDYFDEKIVRGTELAEPEDTTREDILKEAGYEQVYDIDEIITRMPTPDEITRLGIPAGTPVAEHIRTGYTADRQASPGDDLRRPRRHADPAIHHPDLASGSSGRRSHPAGRRHPSPRMLQRGDESGSWPTSGFVVQ